MGSWERDIVIVGILYVITGIVASIAYDFWIAPYLQKTFSNGGVDTT